LSCTTQVWKRLDVIEFISDWIDCGLTHYHDADIKQALLEIAPEDKERIEVARFGEIKVSYGKLSHVA
jgi:hypothetical protein